MDHRLSDTQWRRLRDAAAAPYRRVGRFAWHFARGKLGMDPVFRHLVDSPWFGPRARVLDIGCGQGLLASLLLAGERALGRPAGVRITGIEMMPRDVARAEAALAAHAAAVRFVCADMRAAELPTSDVVVILDVLHYIPVPEQDSLLERVHAVLDGGGHLLLRIGDAGQKRGYAISQWVDRVVTGVRGHRAPPTHGRRLADWLARLHAIGFAVEARPMSRGTPFSNVLLVARKATTP